MKRWLARSLLLLVSTGLGLLVANWAAGRWLPLPALLYRLDDELLFAPVPNARRVLPLGQGSGGAWITTELESHGFRGRELREPKRGPRVLVLGDSLVLAETSPLAETYCAQLARELEGAPEVVNAGVSGYGPDQECLRLEQLLGPLAPDLVVLVLCAHNDFGDLVRDKLFRLDNREELVRNHPTLDHELLQRAEAARRISRPPALWLALERLRTRAAPQGEEDSPALIDLYLQGAQAEYTEFVTWRDDVVRSLTEDYYDADVAIRPNSESAQFKQRLMERVLGRVRDDCARQHVPLFALVVPTSVDLCPGFRIHVDPARHPSWSPTRITDALASILERLGIAHLDLTPAFREHGAEQLYLGRGDFHWNAAGEELGAARSVEFLRQHALWPPRR